MAQIGTRTGGSGFSFQFRSGQGGRVVAFAERLQLKEHIEDATAGIFYNVIERWRRQEFNARLPGLLSQVLHIREAGGLSSSYLRMVAQPTEEKGREGTYLYHLQMKMPGRAEEYGYTQEVGRPENMAKIKGKYYMVPLLSAFPPSKGRVDIKKELSDPNVWLLPRGDNFATDKAGRKVKYVFRFKNAKEKASNRQKRATGRAAAKVGTEAKAQRSLKGRGTLLFLAYPSSSTGIPGASRGRYAKKRPKLASPLMKYGFLPGGGLQASRWFTYSLIKTLPALDTMLRTDTGRQLAGAVKASMGSGLGGR